MNNWERNGLVSVWVGTVASDAELRAYLAEQYEDDNAPISKFATDCGLNWYDHDFVESRFTDEISIADLLLPFSYSDTFAEAAVRDCLRKGIFRANAAIVMYNCDASELAGAQCKLNLVGTFEYSL